MTSLLMYDFVFFTIQMLEDGMLRAAAPECRYGPGWIYWNGHCYQYTSYHEDFLKAEEICNEQGAYLADIITAQEGAWIKSVLLLINPKGIYNSYSSMCRDVMIQASSSMQTMYNFTNFDLDGTDYWIGGLDANKDKQLQWMTGNLMNKTNTY